ncbi:carboxypeptidase-like regulatory domain-containing protein [bacterium]|nr:carboxypeptidase-like regulatory domain-containing protein [bacterium]
MKTNMRITVLLILLNLLHIPRLFSANTGKIRGTVIDAETKTPLFGVNVLIGGTAFGAAADVNGNYVIINIPAGTYEMHVMYMGYAKLTVKNVIVAEGVTTFRDFELSSSNLVGQDVVIVAERPLIEKGEINEVHRLSGEDRAGTSGRTRRRPEQSGLRAGFADDNKQYNYYLNFIKKYKEVITFYPVDITERISVYLKDRKGNSIPNANITINSDLGMHCAGKTYSNGSYLFFPSQYEDNISEYIAEVSYQQFKQKFVIKRNDKRIQVFTLDTNKKSPDALPVDILFILDTTGSMGEEINRLKKTIEIINLNLESLSNQSLIRYGMVLYRDRSDEYITKITPFTSNLKQFLGELNNVTVDGGGDTPEALQSALKSAMNDFDWNQDGLRLSFIVTDAPPQLYADQAYNYTHAMTMAKQNGVKLFSVGTGGLDLQGEFVLRQVSQYTSAKYIFLTYGEVGESEGGKIGSVSHHTGSNYKTENLESIIIKIVKDEIFQFTDKPLEDVEDYFEANKITTEENDTTLSKLFKMSIAQLLDYSSIKIPSKTPTCVLPVVSQNVKNKIDAEYFSQQLLLSSSLHESFHLVERKDFQKILDELQLSMTGLTEETDATRVGKLIGAKLIVAGDLFEKVDHYDVFLRMFFVETGEVLAVTKLQVDKKLGLLKK